MSRLIRALALAILLPGLIAARARADLTISGGNVSWGAGGTGTMDITISSNSGDTLSYFGLELLITPVSGTGSFLQFTTSPDPYGNSNYVFSGVSSNNDVPPAYGGPIPFWSPPLLSNYPSDTITGGDSDDGSGAGYVTIPATPTGPNSYLATVQFQAPIGASSSDAWTISLVADPDFTYFQDANGHYFSDPPVASGVLVTYGESGESGVLGTFITPQIASIPEPLSAITSLTGAFFFTAYGWFRLHRSKRDSA